MRVAHVRELGLQLRAQLRRLDVAGNLDDRVCVDGALELGGRVEREQVPVVDDCNPLAELVGLLHVVGDEDDRLPGRVQLAHELVQGDPALRVETRGRLVEEEHRRSVHDRARDHQPLRHAARERIDGAVGDVGERDPLEQGVRLAGGVGGGHAEETPVEHEVLAHAEAAIERVALGDDADELPRQRRPGDDVDAGHPSATGRRQHPGGQHSRRRRLAGAVRQT
jgi:hypothetical protein